MPAKKKPVAVLKSDGSRHYTKAELADRESREVQAPKTEKVNPPAYLDRALVREFNKLAPVLVRLLNTTLLTPRYIEHTVWLNSQQNEI